MREGIITRFRSEIDFFRLGYKTYRLYIRLEGADAQKEQEIFQYLENSGVGIWLALCEGQYNIVFRFVARDEFDFKEVLRNLYESFSLYLRERDLAIPLETNFYPGESGVYETGKTKYKPPERSEAVRFDDVDVKLLGILSDDARAPSSKIAAELGLTPNAVRYRVRKLEQEGVIMEYQMVADRTKLGMYHYKVLLNLQKASDSRVIKFVRYCETLPNLVYLGQYIGTWDMELDFDFKNVEELHNSVLELTSRFRELVRSYETLSVFKSTYCNPLKTEKK